MILKVSSTGTEVSQDIYGNLDGNGLGYTDLFPDAEVQDVW